MDFSGQQWKKLQEAFIDAFPDKSSLEQMLLFGLDKHLDAIVEGGSLEKIVFNLIKTAVARGWVFDLIDAARKENPGNSKLNAIAQEFLTSQGTKTSPQLLFDLLLQMDFKQQVQLVEDVLEQHRTAAFLVHGEPGCGQELLVTRLFRIKSAWKNNSPIKNDVTSNAAYRSVERLWKQLARSFLLPLDAKPEQIIDRICDRWQTQDVIFIFDKADCILPMVLSSWLQEFWEPLVDRGKFNPPLKDTHLLMFLVDNCGSVCKSQLMLAKQFDEPEYPRIPLYLPPVSPFPTDVLKDWLRDIKVFRDLQIPCNLTYQRIWENSDNGIPPYVYEEICTHFNLSWEGDLAKWLI